MQLGRKSDIDEFHYFYPILLNKADVSRVDRYVLVNYMLGDLT